MNDERNGSAIGESRAEMAAHDVESRAMSGVMSGVMPADTPLQAAPAAAPSQRPLTHQEKRIIAISMMLPVFIGSVDQTILATALPTIGRNLGDIHNLPWLITAFLIAATALTPLYGKFADIHGRRAAMLIGLGVYMVGAVISASSPNLPMLICGRIVQGCGAGGLTAIGNMVLGDIAAPKERGRYYTYFSIAFTTAGGTGPVLGGWICDHLPWQAIFLWSLPLCVVAVIIAATMLQRLPRRGRQHRLDFIGAILVIVASSSFMLALNLGGVRYAWLSPLVLGLLGGAFALGTGFVVRLVTAEEPLIPIAILADPAARLTIAAHSFGWGTIICLNVFLPMYLQSTLGWSATSAGLSMMTLMVVLNASAGLAGQVLGRVRHYKRLPLCCQLISIGAVVALALSASSMTSLKFEIILFLIGIGFGPSAPLTQVALLNTVPSRDLGAAVGTMNFARSLMGTILVAVIGAVLLSDAPSGAPDMLNRHLLGAASAGTFSIVFFALAGMLTAAFVAVLLLEEKPLQETHAD